MVSGWTVVEMEGWRILVGRNARANDELTFGVGRPKDLWLHAQGATGSHVLVQVPDDQDTPPPTVVTRAAELAAWHSKARGTGRKATVHVSRVQDVRKDRGSPPGQVRLVRYRTLRVYPRGMD